MEIQEVSVSFYTNIIPSPFQIFSSANFNELNKSKCETIFYLLFKDNKYRLGIIVGERNNILYSPFSAPFGGFAFLSGDIRLQSINEALDLIEKWANEKHFTSINITLPPAVYNESFIGKQANCLFRKGYEITKLDLNYSYHLDNFDECYPNYIWYNARKNLKVAQNSGLTFTKCNENVAKMLAFDIISQNREARGFPLRMTWQQVSETISLINADFFIVNNEKKVPIAAAIIFHINNAVVQVIYWGDLPEYARLKTMNYLSFKVFEYYKATGKKIVDIGPSTEDSVPNYGLCEFKEGIGCQIDPKLTFKKKLS